MELIELPDTRSEIEKLREENKHLSFCLKEQEWTTEFYIEKLKDANGYNRYIGLELVAYMKQKRNEETT